MRIGGAEQVIFNLVRATDPARYAVSVLCLEDSIGPFGVQLKKFGFRLDTLDRKPGFDWSLIRKIRAFVRKNRIDVLHCHQYTPYAYGVFGAAFIGCKVVFTEHGRFYPDVRKTKRCIVNPFLNRLTGAVTAISTATASALERYENFPRRCIRVIYNGIDNERFLNLQKCRDLMSALGISGTDFVLGAVARLDSIKNHPMMIKAFGLIRRKYPYAKLLIVGDGPERQGLEALTAELGLKGSVVFSGFREDTERFYALMDVFLLTSFSEGTAMTLLEAMAAGLPCIATGVGGNPEIVKDGETGFIVPSGDEAALAAKIEIYIKNKDLIKNTGLAGRRRFEENFTVAKMASAYQEIYDRLCKK
jgi:glycosyltransferase involved in cell wall biosynthesis